MSDFTSRNILRIFFRRTISYLMILLVTIMMVIPILLVTQKNIRANVLNAFQNNLDRGAYDLETKINAVLKIGSAIQENSSYRQLLKVEGKPSSEMCIEMNSTQKAIALFGTSHEYIKDMYILFANNDLYISNYIVSEDYRSAYPLFFKENDLTAETWRDNILNSSSTLELRSSAVVSQYGRPHSYHSLILVTSITPELIFSRKGVLVCHLDFNEFISHVIQDEMQNDCFLYIEDRTGNIIVSHNYTPSISAANTEYISETNEHYTLISSSMDSFEYKLCMGVPDRYFFEITNQSFRFLLMYVLIGTVLIILISITVCIFETSRFKKVLVAANSLLPTLNTPPTFTNEMSYIHNVLTASVSQLEDLRKTLQTHVLANLFFFPLPPEKMAAVDEMFGLLFSTYSVIVLQLKDCSDESSLHQHMFTLIELCRNMISVPFVYTHTNLNELSILIDLKHFSDDLSVIVNGFDSILKQMQHYESDMPIIHIGVSKTTSGAENASAAYTQAKAAINMQAAPTASGVYVYNTSPKASDFIGIDPGVLSRLYDSILCGDFQNLSTFFAKLKRDIHQQAVGPQEHIQLLYALRLPIYNAHTEITSSNADEAPVSSLAEVDLARSFRYNINLLEQSAYELCNQVHARKKIQHLRFNEEIMSFIYQNCYDPNFTPHLVASEFRVSENHILNLVKEITGKSLKNLIESQRVDKAEDMLRSREHTNSQIAAECGFGSENTFYRAFARRHGMSPSKWAGR